MASPLPARADIAGTPSNAQARAALTAEFDYLAFLLGTAGTVEEARGKLGIGNVSNRNKLINGRFQINQIAVSGSVVLAAGAYGHDGWKAGAGGCTYTFAKAGNLTTVTITAGTLQQVVDGRRLAGGNYVLSWDGSAQGRVAAGAYAVSPVLTAGVTAAANTAVEFGTGTLTNVQFEPGTLQSVYDDRDDLRELIDCQDYFRTSFVGVAPGTASSIGRKLVLSSSSSAYAQFEIWFDRPMRATPTFTFYNPSTGTAGQMRNETNGANYGVSAVGTNNLSVNGARVQANTAPPASQVISLHYTADARL